jgi:hypothetical protein
MLTATVWGYFASLQSYGIITASQAEMIDLPGLSYGMFHAQVKPNRLYGIVTTSVKIQGLNIDVGHLRHNRWVKDDDPSSAINAKPELTQNGGTAAQTRWIGYNRTRGQHDSAMEHATPEAFWVDKNQCRYVDENGQMQNPAYPDCAQAISAVKALAIAQQQGQKIYTITPQNAGTALASLPVGGSVGQEIRNAVNAGREVTVHEKPINAFGWSGYGYSIIDPETGAGGFLIEGSGNGGSLAEDITSRSMQMAMLNDVNVDSSVVISSLSTVTQATILAKSMVVDFLSCYANIIVTILLCVALALLLAWLIPALVPVLVGVGTFAVRTFIAMAAALLPQFAAASNGGECANKNWTCTASCNLQVIDPRLDGLVVDHVTGIATGHSEENACTEAKWVATQSAPRGTYARHCRCVECTK